MGTPDKVRGRRVMAGNLEPVILMRDLTVGNLDALMEGRVIGGHAVDYIPGAAQVVLTEGLTAGISDNILEHQMAIVTGIMVGLHTLNDDCHFEIGWTTAVDGGGVFTPLMMAVDYHSGNVQSGPTTLIVPFDPYVGIRYRAGARSITFRVDANDAAAEITCHWHGFYITE